MRKTDMSGNLSHVKQRADRIRRAFRHNGFLMMRGVLGPDRTGSLYEECRATYGKERTRESALFLCSNAAQKLPFVADLMEAPEVLRVVVSLLGPFIHLISSELWVRPSGAPAEVWHRDGGPAMLHLSDAVSVKVQFFLSDLVDESSGNLVIAPGSHRWDIRKGFGGHKALESKARVLTVKAGDAVAWYGHTYHRVQPNQSNSDRVSIILGYALLWARPYDYDRPDESFLRLATPLQSLLVSGAQSEFTRGQYYYPHDREKRLALIEERVGPVVGSLIPMFVARTRRRSVQVD